MEKETKTESRGMGSEKSISNFQKRNLYSVGHWAYILGAV